jgi:hypothetical protein
MRLVNDNGVIRTSIEQDGDTVTIHSQQDVEPALERNRRLRQETDGMSDGGTMYHIGSIPWNVITIWNKLDGVDFMQMPAKDQEKYMMRKLQDPDWAYLRTTDRGI